MEDNDWYISTCGYGITAFTDAGIEYIGEQIVPYLSDKDFAGAFEAYITLCDEFITQARTGKPYDIGSFPRKPLSPAWLLGLPYHRSDAVFRHRWQDEGEAHHCPRSGGSEQLHEERQHEHNRQP